MIQVTFLYNQETFLTMKYF